MSGKEIKMENIDELTEEELRLLEKQYKEEHLPSWRLKMLIPYNIVIGGLTMYYTIHFKYFSKKLFKPKTMGLAELFKYGTI